MSEAEPLTGHAAVEQGQGYKPLPDAPKPEPEVYGGSMPELERASNDHTRSRDAADSAESEPVKRSHIWISGPKAGEAVDLAKERFAGSAEWHAKDLSAVHEAERNLEIEPQLQDLANEVDLARAQAAGQQPPDGQQQPPQAETPPPIDSPQPEASASDPHSGLSPKLQQALQDPELRAAYEAPYQAAAQVQQAYTQATAQVAEAALASVFASFPELGRYNAQQLPMALDIIGQQNPQRRAEIDAHLNRVNTVYQAAQQAKQVEAYQNQQRYQQWSKAEDDRLLAKIPELANDTDMRVSKAAVKALNDVGFSNDELAAAWQGAPISMRDHRAQLLIWKAAQYDMARAGVGRPEPKPLPTVQRPGIAPSAGERAAVDLSELRSEFKRATGNEQLRLAAKLQQAQRRARG